MSLNKKPTIRLGYICASFNSLGQTCTGNNSLNMNVYCYKCNCYVMSKPLNEEEAIEKALRDTLVGLLNKFGNRIKKGEFTMKKESNPNAPSVKELMKRNDSIEAHLNWLGVVVIDKVTEWEGVVTSISFDLYGCVQVLVTKSLKKEDAEEPSKSWWMDVKRVVPKYNEQGPLNTPNSNYRVMDVPQFQNVTIGEEPGPAEKPIP